MQIFEIWTRIDNVPSQYQFYGDNWYNIIYNDVIDISRQLKFHPRAHYTAIYSFVSVYVNKYYNVPHRQLQSRTIIIKMCVYELTL